MRIILIRTNSWSREDAIKRRSRLEPDALIVDLRTYVVARNGVEFKFERGAAKVFVLLAAASPRLVSREELAEALWGDRADGGPEDKILDKYLTDARFIAPALGLRIATNWGRGHTAEELRAPVSELAGADQNLDSHHLAPC